MSLSVLSRYYPETHLVFTRADIPDQIIMMLPRVMGPPIQHTSIRIHNLPCCFGFNQECQRGTTRPTGRLHSSLPSVQVPVPNTVRRGRPRQPTSLSLPVLYINRARVPPGLRLKILLAHTTHGGDRTVPGLPTNLISLTILAASLVNRARHLWFHLGLSFRVLRVTGTHWEDRARTRASQPTGLIPLALRASLMSSACDLCLRLLRIKVLLACITHWDRTRKCTSIVLFFCQSHTEDSRTDRTTIAKKRKALIVCDCQTK